MNKKNYSVYRKLRNFGPEENFMDPLSVCLNSNEIDLFYYGHTRNAEKDILNFKSNSVTFPSNFICKKEAFRRTNGFNPKLSNVADKMFYLDIIQQI